MRKILIPTDFSEVSKNALLYCLDLYKGTESVFDIIHVYHPAFDPGQTEILDVASGVEKILDNNMSELISSIGDFQAEINSKVELGFAIEKIIDLSFHYDIIVMGTTGQNSILGKIFGSVSSDVASNAHCPVLLIPPDTVFSGYENIIYSCDFEGVNEAVLSEIISFSKRYNSKLHFVHIKDRDAGFELELPKDIDITYTINETESNSVAGGVNEFIKEKDADLVIMATKQRSFWEKIIHKNHTKELAINIEIPLLVYHESKK